MKNRKQSSTADEAAVTRVTVAYQKSYGALERAEGTPLVPDAFLNYYSHFMNKDGVELIVPPYSMESLEKLVFENNTLAQAISAMEVNVDGTGYTVIKDGIPSSTPEESADILKSFEEIYPGMSFVSLRRLLRRDVEIFGNGYMEVIRAVSGKITFLNVVPAATMRLVTLDSPVQVAVNVHRMGADLAVKMMMSERRFASLEGNQIIFYKQFGSTRKLHRLTGQWETAKSPVPLDQEATEVLHFTAVKVSKSPYGIPRWINQTPSAVGSRKAEEINLDFLRAGAIPSALIFIQGGSMAAPVRQELNTFLRGNGKGTQRIAVLETYANSGDINSNSNVQIKVERFSSEQQKDSLFENYDARCERRIRSAFRLSPLFVGQMDDFSYASALISYLVAETQVFAPERVEFDELFNVTIMRSFAPGWKLKSIPLNIKDATVQINGLVAAKGLVSNESWVAELNKVLSAALDPKAEEEVLQDRSSTRVNRPNIPSGTPQSGEISK